MIETKCDCCGTIFKKTKYKHERSKLHFCSIECKKKYGIIGNKYIKEDKIVKILITSRKYGDKYILIDNEDIEKCNKYTWSVRKDKNNFYAVSNLYTEDKKKTVILHRLILNCGDEIIDHINKNGLDNRKCNLRVCTRAVNRLNSRLNKNNTTGFCGVYFNKNINKYQARLKADGKEKSLGYFNTAVEANEARKQAQATKWDY